MSLRVDQNFHSLVIERVRLAKIQHIEANFSFGIVLHSEEKPLSVAPGVYIILQQQMVIIVIHFGNCCKISGFKTTFKQQGIVGGSFSLVELLLIYFY